MVTHRIHRRQWLLWVAAGLGVPAWAAPARTPRFLAAWQEESRYAVGWVALSERHWRVERQIEVPTRAHGLCVEPSGSVLAVSRRPGDWLLRWYPDRSRTQWHWVEDDRRFNGHAVFSADHARLWTTEIEGEEGAGLVALRDARSLHKLAEWFTHGHDPHQLLVLPRSVGAFPVGTLMVANGGIATKVETGRSKHLAESMDASLVALDPRTGERLGQWRLSDPWLSIRHLAWDPVSGCLGIALQAEHPAAQEVKVAPVLAVWDGDGLRLATDQPALAGYGGDLAAVSSGGFAVSCPRANGVAVFDAQARWQKWVPLIGAYAMTSHGADWWVGSGAQVSHEDQRWTRDDKTLKYWQWDNHWVHGS